MDNQKVWFVTGASKGFGFEIAKAALEQGDKVVGTVRSNPIQLMDALNNNPALLVLLMDVTKEDETIEAAQAAITHFGRIDILVNNAGFGIIAAIEEASDAEARKQYDTNVFGLLNVTRSILPYMRLQKKGHVINISSLFGYGAYPGWGLYGSTKFAVEGISAGLALELAPLGIKVTAAAPGLFTTGFLGAGSFFTSAKTIHDYDSNVAPMKSGADKLHGRQPGDPVKLAKVIVQLANAPNPPLHLPIGKDAVGMYKISAAEMAREVEEWLEVSNSTDHEKNL